MGEPHQKQDAMGLIFQANDRLFGVFEEKRAVVFPFGSPHLGNHAVREFKIGQCLSMLQQLLGFLGFPSLLLNISKFDKKL